MSLQSEIGNLGNLKEAGWALKQFAESRFPDSHFAKKSNKWVCDPKNYVTFTVHWKRAQNITVSLRGTPKEFLEHDELPLRDDMHGYSAFKFEDVRQLKAAVSYIDRAAVIYKRGRNRIKKQLVLKEVSV